MEAKISFVLLDITSGKVITKMTVAHRAVEFIQFLELIDKKVPKELDVHIVLDNYTSHRCESV